MYELENRITGRETEQISNRKNALSGSMLSANEKEATWEKSTWNLCPRQNPTAATAVPTTNDPISSAAGRARPFLHRWDIRVTMGTESIATRNELNATSIIGGVFCPAGG